MSVRLRRRQGLHRGTLARNMDLGWWVILPASELPLRLRSDTKEERGVLKETFACRSPPIALTLVHVNYQSRKWGVSVWRSVMEMCLLMLTRNYRNCYRPGTKKFSFGFDSFRS